MRKMKYVVGILLLFIAIGFATVTVSLSIMGNAKILSDVDDFKVYFSDVKFNGERDFTLVKSETELTFDLSFSSLGDPQVITYDVTNASKIFDAALTMSCTQGDEIFSVVNVFDTTTNLEALGTRSGTLTMKKLKANASEEDIDYSVTCILNATPVERTEEATGSVVGPVKVIGQIGEEIIELHNVTIGSGWRVSGTLNTATSVSSSNKTSLPATFLTPSLLVPKANLLVNTLDDGTEFENYDLIRIQNLSCVDDNNLNYGEFLFNGFAWELITEPAKWCKNVDSEIIAFSPAVDLLNGFEINADQSTESGLKVADIMVGKYVGSQEDGPININMEHMMSKITFIPALGPEYEGYSIADADFKIYSKDSILMYEGNELLGDETPVAITPYHSVDSDSYTALISPGYYYNPSQTFLEVQIGENTLSILAGDIQPTEGFKPGYNYFVNVKIGADTVDNVEISIVQTDSNWFGYNEDIFPDRIYVTNESRVDVNQVVYEKAEDSYNYIASDLLLWRSGVENYFTASTNPEFTLPTDQSTFSGLLYADLMVGTVSSYQSPTLPISMIHSMSQIQVNVASATEYDEFAVKGAQIYCNDSTVIDAYIDSNTIIAIVKPGSFNPDDTVLRVRYLVNGLECEEEFTYRDLAGLITSEQSFNSGCVYTSDIYLG